MDEFGPQGYAWWFLLLELCADKWDGKSEPKFNFHQRIVRQKLRTSLSKVQLFLEKSQTLGQLYFNFSGKEIEIEIPKLLEIKSSRNVVKNSKGPIKKRIDKNRIEKNRIDKTSKLELDVFNLWNEVVEKNDGVLPKVKSLTERRSSAIKSTIKLIPELSDVENWEKYFSQICTTPFLIGVSGRGWKASFEWAINKNNAVKVLEGQYSNGPKSVTDQIRENIDKNPYRQQETK
jgi:hypothetical protein